MGVFSGNNCNFANRDGVREILITLPFSLLTGLEPPIKAMVYTGASRNAKLKGRGVVGKHFLFAQPLHILLVKRQPQLSPGDRGQGKCSIIDPHLPHTHFIKEAVKLQTHQRLVQGQELELQQGILS